MTAIPSSGITPETIDELCMLLAKLHGAAQGVVEGWNLMDEHRVEALQYHEGRRDAYDVALYWANEMRRVQRRKT